MTASKIYLGALLVYSEAPEISLLDNPNSNLYFSFGVKANPLNFNRARRTKKFASGFVKLPSLISQELLLKNCILALTFIV